ncbi:hypothetical protein AB0F17_14110 [Nonomuraea sp. NPDC026600]|uniref:hypothetical protein n=1 Tax=Nonomuraea sp. NPDC026600 TaxID=3155363 RepID=UPI0034106416
MLSPSPAPRPGDRPRLSLRRLWPSPRDSRERSRGEPQGRLMLAGGGLWLVEDILQSTRRAR